MVVHGWSRGRGIGFSTRDSDAVEKGKWKREGRKVEFDVRLVI